MIFVWNGIINKTERNYYCVIIALALFSPPVWNVPSCVVWCLVAIVTGIYLPTNSHA